MPTGQSGTWPHIPIVDGVEQIMDFRGRTPKKLGMDWGGGDIPAISARNVRMGHIDFAEDYYLASIELYRRWMTHGDMELGDALITTEAPLGNVASVPDGRQYILSQRVVLLRPKPDCFHKGFFLYALQAREFQRLLRENASGSTALGIQRKRLERLELPKPSIDEQSRIASVLADTDDLLDSLKHLIVKKRAIKQGMMQELLTGRTRLPGYQRPWIARVGGDTGSFRGGTGFPRREQGILEETYPFFKVSDMNSAGNGTFMQFASNSISEATRARIGATVFPAGAIVFAKVGAAVYLERKRLLKQPSCIDNNMAALVVDSAVAEVRFIHYLLTNFQMSSLVAVGALPSVNGSQLRSIPVTMPADLGEQQAITKVLMDADAEIAALERRIETTRAIKHGMMQELLTGRTRLQVEGAVT